MVAVLLAAWTRLPTRNNKAMATMHHLHVTCPVCSAEPGIACTSPRFPGLSVEHRPD